MVTASDFPLKVRFSAELLAYRVNDLISAERQKTELKSVALECTNREHEKTVSILKGYFDLERKRVQDLESLVRSLIEKNNELSFMSEKVMSLKNIKTIQKERVDIFNPLIVENLHEQHEKIQTLQGYLKTIYEIL
jgi:hypothetical protein